MRPTYIRSLSYYCNSSKMNLLRAQYVTILIVTLSQIFTFSEVASSNDFDYIDTRSVASSLGIENILKTYSDRGYAGTRATCTAEMLTYLQGITNIQTWALTMLDASSKLQSGIFKGNLVDLGMYDECIGIRPEDNDAGVQGRHCMYNLNIASPTSTSYSIDKIGASLGYSDPTGSETRATTSSISLKSSLCLPASCNEEDVVRIINNTIGMISIGAGTGITVGTATCAKVEAEDFTTGEIITITVIAFIASFMVLCTICNFMRKILNCDDTMVLNIIGKFSLYDNAMRLLSTRSTPDTMPAIHGLRFLTMCWVVIGHQYLTGLLKPLVNQIDILDWTKTWHSLYITTATFAVDTFFVLSGFLMTYLFFKEMKKGRSFNLPMYYIHRYVRLTPPFMMLVLITIFLLPRLGSGPTWESGTGYLASACRKNWWTNLLYVHNFVNPRKICLGHSWYLAVDMQLFWLSPIILIPLHRWPKVGQAILGVFFIASLVIPTVIFVLNEYSTNLFSLSRGYADILDQFFGMYIPTYTRAAPWIIGIYLGHHVATRRRTTLTKMQIGCFWTLAVAAIAFCILAYHQTESEGYEYNLPWETFYSTMSRFLWGVAIAWILYACTQGYGGPVTKLLSLPIFFPLSRLSYCIYLVHFVLEIARNSAVRTPSYFSDFAFFNVFCGTMVMSIGIAFIFSMFFETPVVVLEKLLLTGSHKKIHKSRGESDAADA